MRTHTGQVPRTACHQELIALFTFMVKGGNGVKFRPVQTSSSASYCQWGLLNIQGVEGLDSVPSKQDVNSVSLVWDI